MLGRLRRTTRTDIGLALAFVGVAYLVWALVAGISRQVVQELIRAQPPAAGLPGATSWLKVIFVDAGVFIDIVGVTWLVASLVLVVCSSRQRLSISWPWACGMCQSCVAALGAVLVGWAAQLPYRAEASAPIEQTALAKVSGISLAVGLALGLVIWVTFLVWLLVERARYDRHGPTLRDGLRTNVRL